MRYNRIWCHLACRWLAASRRRGCWQLIDKPRFKGCRRSQATAISSDFSTSSRNLLHSTAAHRRGHLWMTNNVKRTSQTSTRHIASSVWHTQRIRNEFAIEHVPFTNDTCHYSELMLYTISTLVSKNILFAHSKCICIIKSVENVMRPKLEIKNSNSYWFIVSVKTRINIQIWQTYSHM